MRSGVAQAESSKGVRLLGKKDADRTARDLKDSFLEIIDLYIQNRVPEAKKLCEKCLNQAKEEGQEKWIYLYYMQLCILHRDYNRAESIYRRVQNTLGKEIVDILLKATRALLYSYRTEPIYWQKAAGILREAIQSCPDEERIIRWLIYNRYGIILNSLHKYGLSLIHI